MSWAAPALPLGGVKLLQVLCRGGVQGAPDHVCHWAVSGCCLGCCPGCCQGAPDHVCHWAVSRWGAVQGAPDHVCHWAVSGCCAGCCPGCSGSCLPLGGVRVLRIMFAIGRCQGAVQGAVQGAPDHVCHWGARVLSRVLRIMFAIVLSRGAVEGIMFAMVLSRAPIGRCQGAVEGLLRVLSRVLSRVLCRVLSRVCLRLGGVRVLCKGQGKQSGTRIQRFNFYLGSMLV